MKAIQIISQENLGVGPPGTYRSPGLINREGVQAQEKAVGSLAGELTQFGQMIQTSIRRDMVSHNYALAQQEIAKTELDMQADPDHRTIEGKFDNSLKDIKGKYAEAIPDPVARKVFQDKFLEYETDRKTKMKYYVYSREVDTQKGHLVEELDSKARLIEQTDLDDMKNYNLYLNEALDTISQREASGVITPQKGAELRLAFKDMSAKLRVYRSIMDNPYEAHEKLSADNWQATFPYLKEDDRLDAAAKAEHRILSIEKANRIGIKEKEAEAKKLNDATIENRKGEVLKMIEFPSQFGKISPMQIVNDPVLPEHDREHFLKVIDDKAKADKKEEKSVYEKTDHALYAAWKQRIYLNPDSIENINEIWKDHGKGLSTSNVSELTELYNKVTKEPKTPKSTALTRGIKTLEEMRKLGMFGDIKKDDEVLVADRKFNEFAGQLEMYSDENPKADDKMIGEYIQKMTATESTSWWKTWSDFIGWPMVNIGAQPGGPAVDPKRLQAIKILRDANKAVNETTIKAVMGRLK